MEWTAEQVETLKRLHLEGLSCSRIAWRMGNGLTRNAVIGKIARLKLNNGRQPPINNRGERPKRPRKRRDWTVNLAHVAANYDPEAASLAESAVAEPPVTGDWSQPRQTQKKRAVAPPTLRPLIPPTPSGKVTILELTEKTCKWPIGQVGEDGFHFCGAEKPNEQGIPYCEYHRSIARQPKSIPAKIGKRHDYTTADQTRRNWRTF